MCARSSRVLSSLALALMLSYAASLAAAPQGTAFTYQGRLLSAGAPLTESRAFKFKLYDAETSGSQVGSTLTFESSSAISISDGLFNVELDFGSSAFDGTQRWLEIETKATGGSTYETLTPRQPITSTPYAVHSSSADVAVEWDGSAVTDAPAARTALGLGALATKTTVDNGDWNGSGTPLALGNGGTGATTQAGARTSLGLGTISTKNSIDNDEWDGGGTALAVGNGGTGATSASAARSNLGIGTIAIQNSPLPVANGGTAATSAGSARTNLGLGTISTLNSIDDGNWNGAGTALGVNHGGTGSTTASGARTSLGLGSIATVNSPVPVANGGTASTTASAARTALGAASNSGDTLTGTYNFSGTANAMTLKANSPRNSTYDALVGLSQASVERSSNAVTKGSVTNGYEIGLAPTTGGATVSITYPLSFVPGTVIQEIEVYVDGKPDVNVDIYVARHRRAGGSTSTVALDTSTATSYSFPSSPTSLNLRKITFTPGTPVTVLERETLQLTVSLGTTSSTAEAYVTNVILRLGERVY